MARRGRFVPLPAGVYKVSRSKDRPQWARDLASVAIEIWMQAREQTRSHDWILEQRTSRIFKSSTWRMLTDTERAHVRSTFDACSAIAWRRDLVWRLGTAEGPQPESIQGYWGEGSLFPKLARTPGALYGGHFWKGSDVPFAEYRCSNPIAPSGEQTADHADRVIDEVVTDGRAEDQDRGN